MPFAKRIETIRDAGFDEVMISWDDECEPYYLKKEAFPDIVRNAGLGITNIHAPFMGYNDIWEKSPAENKALLKTFKSYVKDCKTFDIPAVVVHTCDLDLGPYKWENGLAFFTELAEAGEKYGVDIAVENVSRQFLLKGLLDVIKTPHFGMCYDSSHDYMLPCGRGRILKDYKDRIKALHISDNDLHTDRHWIPGEGQIPYNDIMPTLLSTGLEYLSCEVLANEEWQKRQPLEFCQTVRQNIERLGNNF